MFIVFLMYTQLGFFVSLFLCCVRACREPACRGGGGVLLLVWLPMVWVSGWLVLLASSDAAKDAEILD